MSEKPGLSRCLDRVSEQYRMKLDYPLEQVFASFEGVRECPV